MGVSASNVHARLKCVSFLMPVNPDVKLSGTFQAACLPACHSLLP